MGRRGPHPDPLSGRTARGLNSLAGRNVVHLPVRGLGKAKMPSWMNREEKKVWRRLAPELERRGLLTGLDVAAFASLCTAFVVVRELGAIVARDGLTVTDRRGRVSSHPAIREKMKWEKEVLCWLKEFGLTPNSRARLHLPPDPDLEDPKNEFFNF